ncbi:feS assembly protein SufD [Agrilactobacillus composti DSM 18527 = JCM 14202]|uniref:FeS assembly protein SufD n=1 Tax=Agrilactobacillus composti DSM 18527 = JCM 14202 TaxID=1423734 RepID=X0QPM0_9LACO|nr:Fe-S cluster assembly protein SufD [Agrilactobacillus composti]KRM36690.1 feS assembly protein SufD [Agrilactobacillus composti DSM 18527 = JCM 14202]GAF40550.1 iron-sulfur cluster assembly protein SufD [Agrilactobacillus composti DSM 18527 = JCM 14202]
MKLATTLPIDPEQVTAFSKAHGEPAWMTQIRQTALSRFDELEFPQFERMNYRNWPLTNTQELTGVDSDPKLLENIEMFHDDAAGVLIQFGKNTTKTQLDPELAQKGVIFTDIFTAEQKYPELIKQYYMQLAITADANKLTAFHAALMNNGAFVYVPKNVVIKKPLQGFYFQDSTQKQDFVHHLLLIADEGSEVTYLENYQTVGDTPNVANILAEVIAKDNSHVHFSAVDELSATSTTYLNRRGYLMNDAQIDWAIGAMNNGNIISDFDSELKGRGSHAEVNVVAIATGRQVQGIETRVTNYGKKTIGNILQHGVILERATLTFNGVGHIVKGARGSDAQQESRVLMLSNRAIGDANPILLIDENDVMAGHAASVGRVDEQQMYYLMSRGIDKATAERLVIRGFLGSVLMAIPVKAAREQLTATIERKLRDGQTTEND